MTVVPWPGPLDRSRGQRAIAVLYPGMWCQPRYSHLPLDVAAYLTANFR